MSLTFRSPTSKASVLLAIWVQYAGNIRLQQMKATLTVRPYFGKFDPIS